jgi:hypothetical protein
MVRDHGACRLDLQPFIACRMVAAMTGRIERGALTVICIAAIAGLIYAFC